MREANSYYPFSDRASVIITSTMYDRRSLDCTAVIPLLNSLNHLIYLTSTSAKVREVLTTDGGLEQLVYIVKTTNVTDIRSGWKWSMAFQCLVNVGVRGNENVRKRVVEAGTVPVVISLLENFLKSLEIIKSERDRQSKKDSSSLLFPQPNIFQPRFFDDLEVRPELSLSRTTNMNPQVIIRSQQNEVSIENVVPDEPRYLQVFDNFQMNPLTEQQSSSFASRIAALNPNPNSSFTWLDEVFYREEDILLSLQLFAYLSKYPHLRYILHNAYYPVNVFRLVEHFTTRAHAPEIQYWAGIIMRNACRKDESRGGLRQCAYTSCGKWETFPREFAKCRRCRKAKYCSKQCQSRAWAEGHRYWCIDRQLDCINPSNSIPASSNQQQTTEIANAETNDNIDNMLP